MPWRMMRIESKTDPPDRNPAATRRRRGGVRKCGTRYASHATAMAAKITPVVPTPRRYGAVRTLLVILSGVSQETDVTDVAAVHRAGVSSTQGP